MNILVVNGAFLIFAIALFTRGFLLMRLEIDKQSPACKNDLEIRGRKNQAAEKCWEISEPKYKYKKLVVIIIDALRYDFASYQERATDLPFHNKMPIFHQLMEREGCRKARLWRFWADAPTTTMQRIKGLTTGSLPTFIDVSKNFASSEITEDNLLDQFRASGKKITFMGDDTWMNLFRGRFNKAFPYPSFDVKDLHTVDNGILKHLLPEIKLNDWDMLIAHFLGVDHCGHRYGPFHPEMPLKLKQMNDVIEQVVDTIDDETLLLVMGDHGMTHTGDHGGETFNEVNAALFAYSHTGRFKDCPPNSPPDPMVNQVDIVPTISFLLGTSVPFANLGIVINDLIPYDVTEKQDNDQKRNTFEDHQSTLEAIMINAKQVNTYLKTYQKASGSFPQNTYKNLSEDFGKLEKETEKMSTKQRDEVGQKMENYLKSARQMCREVWARFDVLSMLVGLNTVLILLIVNLLFMTKPNFQNAVKVTLVFLTVSTWLSLSVSLVYQSELNTLFCAVICALAFLTFSVLGLNGLWKSYGSMCLIEVVSPSFIILMYAISFTTNSFILNEDITAMYLTMSLITVLTFIIFRNNCIFPNSDLPTTKTRRNSRESLSGLENGGSKLATKIVNLRKKRGAKNHSSKTNGHETESSGFISPNFYLVLLALGSLLCVRLAISYQYCRAEQFWCFDDTIGNDSVSNVSEFSSSGYNNLQLLLSCISLITCIILLMWTLKKEGNLKNSMSLNVFLFKKIFPLCGLCIIISWVLLITPPKVLSVLPEWSITLFPRIVYLSLTGFVMRICLDPVFSCILYPDGQGGYSEHPLRNKLASKKEMVSHMYNVMKDKMNKDLKAAAANKVDKDLPSPIAFGLYTIFSAVIIALVLTVLVLSFLLIGPQKSPALLLWMCASVGVLELNSIIMQQKETLYVPWCSVVTWGFLSCFWWFATGHQASISSIQWDPAFVGFQGNHPSTIVPAVLVLFNTYCMQILSTLSLPLLMLWPLTKGKWYRTEFEENMDSELFFYKDKDKFYSVLHDLFVKYLSFHAAKMVGCMVCACLHRRHLMVWWIFAPRYMFEGVSLIIVLASTAITYFHIRNTGLKIGSWLVSMESKLQ